MINTNSIFVGDDIRLTGKNRHGKNRIRENGELWEVITVNSNKAICVKPLEPSRKSEWRWIDTPSDEHMEIVEIIDNEIAI